MLVKMLSCVPSDLRYWIFVRCIMSNRDYFCMERKSDATHRIRLTHLSERAFQIFNIEFHPVLIRRKRIAVNILLRISGMFSFIVHIRYSLLCN